MGAGILFLPFSPRWLASKERNDEVLVNLAKLRQLPMSDRRVPKEWIEIIAESKFQKEILCRATPKAGCEDKNESIEARNCFMD